MERSGQRKSLVFNSPLFHDGAMTYHALISDTLTLLREEYSLTQQLLTSPEAYQFFSSAAAKSVKAAPPPLRPAVIVPPTKAAAPAPKKAEPIVEEKKGPILKPEQSKKADPMDALRAQVARTLPELKLKTDIPSDAQAKRIVEAWRDKLEAAPVSLLFFGGDEKERAFFLNLAKAIDTLLLPARCVDAGHLEQEKGWDLFLEAPVLKWILSTEAMLNKMPELKRFYKSVPATGSHFIGKMPLLFIENPQHYFKQPAAKRQLWDTLCQTLRA